MADVRNLGGIVRFHRRKSRLSQAQLAELAGVGKTVIYDIEKGKTTVQLDTLSKVLRALNIKIVLESPLMTSFEEHSDARG